MAPPTKKCVPTPMELIENTVWLPSIASAIFTFQYVLVMTLVAMPEMLPSLTKNGHIQ